MIEKTNIYNVEIYVTPKGQIDNIIENTCKKFDNIDELVMELKKTKHYHFRILKQTQYIFFGDLDHYDKNIDIFRNLLRQFLTEQYNLDFDDDEFITRRIRLVIIHYLFQIYYVVFVIMIHLNEID